jgi:ectoine hydroxylase-related dioxygenase (phytanoyl-CoA dioxygenase family)
MIDIKSKYEKNGYFIAKNVINKDQIIDLKRFISTLSPKLMVPYSNEAWGYGNCIELDEFKIISENSKILNAVNQILCDDFEFNHLMVNRKPPWIGPEVEYHQEVFNSKTFAPGATVNEIKEKWCQIYIPLDSETSDNGGLRVISNSHSLGMLESEDIINQNYSHKRRVPVSVLSKLANSNEYKLLDLDLEPGDCIFFSPLLIHGSPSNGTASGRISLVLQSKIKNFVPNNKIFEDEVSYRTSFIIKSLEEKINSIDKNNKYSDFKSTK